MANVITGSRIVLSLVLLIFRPFSPGFTVVYLLAGITDMVDGPVARKTGKVTDFGSKLDTVADLCFVLVCAYKILPQIRIPKWLWTWIVVIVLIKLVSIAAGLIMKKSFPAVHSPANRITGIMLFVFPLVMKVINVKISVIVICAVATFAAVQEAYLVLRGTGN